METIHSDIAIVGAGGAGLRAAIAIAESNPELEIALISKVYPMRSHTCAAEGGAAGVKTADDSLQLHFDDTVSGGDWLCDQEVVEHFVEQAPRELIQLENWGCPWSREDDGSVAVRPFGGMKKKRTWYAADKSGFHILHTLFQTSLQFPSITRYDEYFALDLLHKDGKCCGVVVMEMRSGRFFQINSPVVIGFSVHHQRRDQDRRRHGHGLPGGCSSQGHGIGSVSSDGVAGNRNSVDRRMPRRRRYPGQQGRLPISAGLRDGP
jgi:fumarate reductase flavoprotein subunit